MAAISPVFQSESERIHRDHQDMLRELGALDLALEHMGSPTDTDCVVKARALALALARQLPEHCMREEAKLFATISEVSHELALFVEEMKGEHISLFAQLNAFCVALDELPNATDVTAAVLNLRELGLDTARALRQHITAEEHELQGFL